MPILFNNKPINEDDKKALKDMLSMQMAVMESIMNERANSMNVNYPKPLYDSMAEKFHEASENIDKSISRYMKNKKNVTITEFVDDFLEETVNSILGEIQDYDMTQAQYESFKNTLRGLGNEYFINAFEGEINNRDKVESYNFTSGTFQLPTEPIEGIKNIEEYNPATDSINSLYEGRSGNSSTLKQNAEKIKATRNNVLNDPDLLEQVDAAIEKAERAAAGFRIVAETARMHSVNLINKDTITFADLFNTITDLNKNSRLGDDDGGKFRDGPIFAANIHGVGTLNCSRFMTRTLTQIAECMNQIRKTENEALRKSQAIQLAAYAYQMTLSEHVFDDANGRTCRMFADTILQTFGLPPHTPSEEELSITKTLGEGPMDFKKGSQVFFDCIKKSSDILKEERDEFKKTPEYKMQLEGRIKDLKTVVNNIAKQADEKLKALEAMTKEGHVNGDKYNNMHRALKNVAQMDKDGMTLDRLDNMLDTLYQASSIYQRTHTGWFVATKGYGEDRFNMSKELQEFTRQKTDMIAAFSKGFDKDKKMSEFTAEDLMDVNQPIQIQNNGGQVQNNAGQVAQNKKRSNSISFKDLKNKEKAENGVQNNPRNNAPKHRNSISASPKKNNNNVKNGPQ